jgi:alpha-D-ribose 1-methylphosphonate 5-triphosphate diphosphatase
MTQEIQFDPAAEKTKPAINICNVQALTPQGWQHYDSVLLSNGVIQSFDTEPEHECHMIDGRGHYLLPGIIDVHGDAFERHITPRAGTELPLDLAIAANDNSLIGSGITTFFYSITDGFEPGPRSRQTVRTLLLEIEQLRSRLRCNSYIHLRHEHVNTEDHQELMQWLRVHRIDLLSLNNHLPEMDNSKQMERYLNGLQRRVKMSHEESVEFLQDLQSRRLVGDQQVAELVELAHRMNIPLASHDDATEEDLALSKKRGVSISEFPMTYDIARGAQLSGCPVVMGAPNLIRGGSHVGGMSVETAAIEGVVDILCSDYHYPSLFRAPFLLAEKDIISFEAAWDMVTRNPARAAGLGERKGRIDLGFDADLLLLDKIDGSPLSIRSVFSMGEPVLQR